MYALAFSGFRRSARDLVLCKGSDVRPGVVASTDSKRPWFEKNIRFKAITIGTEITAAINHRRVSGHGIDDAHILPPVPLKAA